MSVGGHAFLLFYPIHFVNSCRVACKLTSKQARRGREKKMTSFLMDGFTTRGVVKRVDKQKNVTKISSFPPITTTFCTFFTVQPKLDNNKRFNKLLNYKRTHRLIPNYTQ